MMWTWIPMLVGGCGGAVWYADLDGDGFGDDATAQRASVAPPGHVGRGGDCDDTDPVVHPGASEVCNGVDDDCDGLADDDDPGVASESMQAWYADTDGDRYGDPLVSLQACAAPEGYVAAGLDCDDTDPTFRTGVFWLDESGAETEVTEAFQSGSLAGVHRFEAPGNGRLELCPGTYYATVAGADELHVSGRIPGTVVLDGAYETRPEPVPTLTVVPGGVLTVQHVTLRNGWQVIEAHEVAVTLRDVTVTGYAAPERGYAILSVFGSLDVEGLLAHDNPGAVLGVGWSDTDIRDAVFTGNGQDAVYVVSVRSDSALLRDVRLHHNHAVGGTLALSSRAQVDGAEITDNQGRGVWVWYSQDVVVSNSVITGNQSEGNGAGIHVDSGHQFTLRDTLVADNIAAGAGGGLYIDIVDGTTVCEAQDGSYGFVGNHAAGGGHAAYLMSMEWLSLGEALSTLDVDGCDFGGVVTDEGEQPGEVVHRHEVWSLPNYGDDCLEDWVETVLVPGDDATFCVGLRCP